MKRQGVGILTIIVLAGLIAYAFVTLSSMRSQVNEAARTQQELQDRIEQLQEENYDLQYALDHQNDPETIGDIARDKLGLVMPDERIYYDAGD